LKAHWMIASGRRSIAAAVAVARHVEILVP
jgi:hypothetical protein